MIVEAFVLGTAIATALGVGGKVAYDEYVGGGSRSTGSSGNSGNTFLVDGKTYTVDTFLRQLIQSEIYAEAERINNNQGGNKNEVFLNVLRKFGILPQFGTVPMNQYLVPRTTSGQRLVDSNKYINFRDSFNFPEIHQHVRDNLWSMYWQGVATATVHAIGLASIVAGLLLAPQVAAAVIAAGASLQGYLEVVVP